MKRLIILLFICTTAIAQNPRSQIEWYGYAKVEDISNLHGGIKTGSVLNAAGRITATYANTFKFGIIGATHTQNQRLYTGALQIPTDLVVQREVRIGDLALQHEFNKNIWGIIGIMDVEDYYNITEAANFLLNSAFGNGEGFNLNTPIASFPYPGFGALLNVHEKNDYLLLGIYQGNPQHQDTVFREGYMLVAEAGMQRDLHAMRMKYLSLKLGAWIYAPHNVPGYTNSQGLYIISQIAWQINKHELVGFLQVDYDHNNPPYVPFSLTAGARLNNLLCTNNHDWLSLGIAKIWIYHRHSEVAYEASYSYEFWEKTYIIPDLQYYVKPSGYLPNAWVFALRLLYRF